MVTPMRNRRKPIAVSLYANGSREHEGTRAFCRRRGREKAAHVLMCYTLLSQQFFVASSTRAGIYMGQSAELHSFSIFSCANRTTSRSKQNNPI